MDEFEAWLEDVKAMVFVRSMTKAEGLEDAWLESVMDQLKMTTPTGDDR